MFCTVMFCTVMSCTVMSCTVMLCTVVFCIVMYCTVIFCANQNLCMLLLFLPSKAPNQEGMHFSCGVLRNIIIGDIAIFELVEKIL